MEKIRVGLSLSTRWTDPPMWLIGGTLALTAGTPALLYFSYQCPCLPIALAVASWYVWNKIYHKDIPCDATPYIEWVDPALAAKYDGVKVPMHSLYEYFIEGKVVFKEDVWKTLKEHRYKFCNFRHTMKMFMWCMKEFIPAFSTSFKGKAATKKEIADHYDRGNDFFAAFLGPSMVYTSGIFAEGLDMSLEAAQEAKMRMVCDKIMLKQGETFLDIGCGWGTLARFAASKFGAKSTGVTLSVEGAAWCNEKTSEEKLDKNCEILCCDYRDIPITRQFNKIASIEMAEHVGLANFQLYLRNVKRLLKDDGLFLMQVAGLRQGSSWEDLTWGLFMGKYIFPGADASTPLNWYIRQCELAGFEVHSVETFGRHYSHTLHRWYLNWLSNRDAMTNKYGARLYRLWEFFLAYASVQSGVGTATVYQIVCHKNTVSYDRDIWCKGNQVSASEHCRGVGISLPKK